MIMKNSLYFNCLACAFLFVCSELHANWALPPINVSAPLAVTTEPEVAIGPNGYAVAVWVETIGPFRTVQGATRAAGSTVWILTNPISQPTQSPALINPNVVVDSNGNAVAIWNWYDGANFIIQGATLTAGSFIWTTPQDLSIPGATAVSNALTMDSQGNALAAWTRLGSSVFVIQAASLPASSTIWSIPVDLSTNLGNADTVALATDLTGNAVATWTQYNGSNLIVQGSKGVRQLDGTFIWSPTNNLSADGFDSTSSQVKLDAAGNAIAVWINYDGLNYIARGARLANNSLVWQLTTPLSLPGQTATAPQLAIKSDGSAVAIWEYSGVKTVIQGAILPAGSFSWTPTSDLSSNAFSSGAPEVGIDVEGNAVAVWRSTDTLSFNAIQAAVLSANHLTWTEPQEITTNQEEPQIAVSDTGEVVSVFTSSNGIAGVSNTITSKARSTANANPSSVLADGVATSTITVTLLNGNNQPVVGNTVSLSPSQDGSLISPASAITDASGKVTFTVTGFLGRTILYTATDVTNNIALTNMAQVIFFSKTPQPPTNFWGSVRKNKYPTQTDYIHVLNWNPSSDPNVAGYRILEGSQVLGVVQAGSPCVMEVHHRNKKKQYTYTLVAFTGDNVVSAPLYVTLP